MTVQRWWTDVLATLRKNPPHPDDLRLAQARVADLSERSDRVVEVIVPRLRRNHWGETVAAIARRE